jgi:iron complex outermembrane receptor protein
MAVEGDRDCNEGEGVMRSSSTASLLGGVAMICLAGTAAFAAPRQDQGDGSLATVSVSPAGAGQQATGAIETVVVTAEKRAENSQHVPIALTAVSGNMLDNQGITGFADLSARIPSLRFGAGVTGGENVITLRGLGSVNTTPGGDSPVAYSIDGVTLQRSTAVDPEYYDINRIEVLRGPQGTLYGRNSVGGSVNVITNKPTDAFGGGVDVLLGDYAQRTFRGWANAPLVDEASGLKIYARVTAVSAQHDPYVKNLSTAATATHNQDAQDFFMVRGQIYVEISPSLNLLLSASTADNKDPAATVTAWWETPTRYMSGPDPIAPGSACDFSTKAKFNPRRICHDYPENASNKVDLYSATLNWDVGFAGLTNVFGYATSRVNQTSDGDGANIPIAYDPVWLLRNTQLSEEVRLASKDEEAPLKWIAGFYYFWSDNYEDFAYSDTGLNDTFPIPGGFDEFNFLSHGFSKTRSFAPFGQLDYDLGKTSLGIPLTLTLGARYSHDDKYGYNYLDYQLPVFCGGSCGPIQGPFKKNWGQWTGKGGITWQVNDSTIAFASASRGYLSGGNIIGLAHIYGPESMWSYDAGVKSQFWDNHLQLNVSAYHEEIEHLQVFIQSSTQSGINNVNGLTQVNGLETELTAVPIDNLRINAALTLTHATYGQYITTDTRFGAAGPGCDPVTKLCNFKGNWLNQTPAYTFDLGAEYNFDTSFGTITPRVDTFFSGKVEFLPDNYVTSQQKAYHMTNFHLTWTDNDGRYKVDAFVNNIENANVISNDGLQSITLGQQVLEPDNFVYYPPRTVGFRFGVNF